MVYQTDCNWETATKAGSVCQVTRSKCKVYQSVCPKLGPELHRYHQISLFLFHFISLMPPHSCQGNAKFAICINMLQFRFKNYERFI
jgi:hypothetical protein